MHFYINSFRRSLITPSTYQVLTSAFYKQQRIFHLTFYHNNHPTHNFIGMCDFEPCVRTQCGIVLRTLVPLAPLAREHRKKSKLNIFRNINITDIDRDTEMDTEREQKTSKLIDNILSRNSLPRITDSKDPYDQYLLQELAKKTNLFPHSSDDKSRQNDSEGKGRNQVDHTRLHRQYVRPYQWDGISWLLHLYHCGLGGILAGKCNIQWVTNPVG